MEIVMNRIAHLAGRTRYLSAAVAVLLALTACSSAYAQGPGRPGPRQWNPQYRYGGRSAVERLADQMWRQANAVCWEMHQNYQGNRGYKEAYAEMHSVMMASRRINDLVKDGYYRQRDRRDDKIARDLHEIDRLFHHIESDVRRWRPEYRRGPGPARGRDLASLMDNFEDSLHNLMDDYGERSRFFGGYDHDHYRGSRAHDHDRGPGSRGPDRRGPNDNFAPRPGDGRR